MSDAQELVQVELQDLGQLTLANFANEAGLAPLGDNLFQETAASGPATVGVPGDPGFATVEQGYLESSNVDPVKEITELISAQRAYEMNSNLIQPPETGWGLQITPRSLQSDLSISFKKGDRR